ncbi:Phosphoenolpyruvate carboxykinase (GTP) [Acidimicrobium ferrooxidans DSM 10331]|uniref:Phosphoenolpyruvate carboxykinase [GTP] n=1 Tax=Acidimicrobium ferrooxidans (strain DSM 10331 / JCM 15462 / NBRC 103882 / ICP) TaxID=525909 RepID=C7LY35_ACIFD|nr:phosphoenolpyruvate carboxykinase (GTP) [Acidimicrobium ferrooxidans]ACU53643.1 Phosphoenolpyruvate carboxykinase (GTP) [Acidimicrobium ferrooxidans DSM 10331]
MGIADANQDVQRWIDEWVRVLEPARVELYLGEREETDRLIDGLIAQGTLRPLDPSRRPRSYVAASDPRDVARLESRTVISTDDPDDAGPTNHWQDPTAMRERLGKLFAGSMRGRTMYVIPFAMGVVGSPFAVYAIELTDSAYVAVSMAKMARVGRAAWDAILGGAPFVPAVHSVGAPLAPSQRDVAWPCDPDNTWIAHFPATSEIWSYGSGYGGNALLGKKCLALRIASVHAREEGWLAEHMLILKLTSPEQRTYYIAAAFPSACGKTNLAMLQPSVPGWRAETIGDDIAWIRPGPDGRLRAVNPEYGFFGVAPGTSRRTNPVAMATISHDTIFTNVAVTPDGDVWWEGMDEPAPSGLITWRGEPYDPAKGPAAHPNARFTVEARQCPTIAPEWEDPNGVPLDAIVFGGRRRDTVPLVAEARSWEHGVWLGATMASETTAAAEGSVGRVRRDPFAMLPFCGYHMGDYVAHWLEVGARAGAKAPRLYVVNWFRRDDEGAFVWPGYGENARVLAWIVDRLEGRAQGVSHPYGTVPAPGELDLAGMAEAPSWDALFGIGDEEWSRELEDARAFVATLAPRFPASLLDVAEAADRAADTDRG